MRIVFNYILVLICFFIFSCGRKTVETKPERKNITESVFASGTLEPENKYNLTAQTDGYISELQFDDGDIVKTGALLAVIDNKANQINTQSAAALLSIANQNASAQSPTLQQALQNLNFLKGKMKQDSLQNVRYQNLYKSNSISKLELETVTLNYENSKTNYQNAEQNYRLTKQQAEQQVIIQRSQHDVSNVSNEYNQLKAVIGGKVYKRMKELGDYVRRGDVIAVIGNPEDIYAKLSVDETNISKLKIGQEAVIELNTEKNKTYKGKVSEIYPAFDEQTQSFFCKIKFTERPQFTIAGTQLQANIIIGIKNNVMIIPRAYLHYGNKVKVKGKDEVDVETGFISNDYVEIISGLKDDETIVTEK